MDLKYCYVSKSAQRLSSYSPLKNKTFLAGVKAWVHALECDLLTFEDVVRPRYLKDYDVFIVNVFPRGIQAQIIREVRPDAIIIGLPDPNLEHVIGSALIGIVEQLRACDGIGGRTRFDVSFYEALIDKPTVWMPSPAGPNPPAPLSFEEREDYIITVDHRAQSIMTAQNVLAAKVASKVSNLPVIYVNPMQYTPLWMDKAGWKPQLRHKMKFHDMLNLIRKAKFGVDMYASHSMHRHAIVHAAVGTPLIKSSWTNPTGHPEFDPMNISGVMAGAISMMDARSWESYRKAGLTTYRTYYSFEKCRERMDKFVESLLH